MEAATVKVLEPPDPTEVGLAETVTVGLSTGGAPVEPPPPQPAKVRRAGIRTTMANFEERQRNDSFASDFM